jgi:hypothetical protein
MSDLKLYVWEGVLADYTDGIAFALASNTKEARKKVLDSFNEGLPDWATPDTYKALLEAYPEFKEKPKVYKNPVGFHLPGGG